MRSAIRLEAIVAGCEAVGPLARSRLALLLLLLLQVPGLPAHAEVRGAAIERGEARSAARTAQPVFGPVEHEPLGAIPVLTGTFGETRGAHFHAGLDYSTGRQVGVPLYAPLAGVIERARSSGVGYGRSLYLRAPDGRLFVYGHLDAFEEPLASFVSAAQESSGQYEQDLWLEPGRFRVAAGQRLGWSGESGIGDPHLHFEVRRGDMAINPLLAGIAILDTLRPVIDAVSIEPRNAQSRIDGRAVARRVTFGPIPDTVRVRGEARVVVEARDPGDRRADMEPYEISMEWDGHYVACRFDSISWATDMDEADFIYDRGRSVPTRRHAVRLWAPAGFRPRVIESDIPTSLEAGTLGAEGSHPYLTLRVAARDFAGNRVERSLVLAFSVAAGPASPPPGSPVARRGTTPGFEWSFPAEALFEPTDVRATALPMPAAAGELHPLSRAISLEPVWLAMRGPLTIRAPLLPGVRRVGLYQNTGSGWDLVRTERDTARRQLVGETHRLGRFALFADRLAPRLRARAVASARNPDAPYSRWAVEVAVVEDGSGMDPRASYFIVDGRRRPAEWDNEKRVLRWRPLAPPEAGAHRFVAVARDRAGNSARLSGSFVLD
jgi:murein DD-endopeptidase MepM/ murein hydrolase activator NlpD